MPRGGPGRKRGASRSPARARAWARGAAETARRRMLAARREAAAQERARLQEQQRYDPQTGQGMPRNPQETEEFISSWLDQIGAPAPNSAPNAGALDWLKGAQDFRPPTGEQHDPVEGTSRPTQPPSDPGQSGCLRSPTQTSLRSQEVPSWSHLETTQGLEQIAAQAATEAAKKEEEPADVLPHVGGLFRPRGFQERV